MSEHGQKVIWDLVAGFCEKIKSEVRRNVEGIPIDLMRPHIHSVFGALLARQGTLAMELAKAVSAWNYHSAPLFIRAMVDVHITTAWLMRDPDDRCLKFIEYGLGQSKLLLEHFKSELAARGEDPDENEGIQKMEAHISAQKFTFLLPVELGAWSGKSTREMATETDLLPMYNFSFQTFSGCVHSTWNHISQYNARPSESPLHRHVFVAAMPEFRPDAHQLDTVARRLDETLAIYQQHFGIPVQKNEIERWLDAALDKIGEKLKQTDVSDNAEHD